MEEQLEERIRQFLMVSNGYGDGDGDGSGDGDGYGDGSGSGSGSGYGDGYGDGSGSGYGDGDGDGSGDGSGIPVFNGKKVYQIDGVATIIESLHGLVAQGYILQKDFTLTPCYVVREGNFFAHGASVREARQSAVAKALEKEPLENRIEKFRAEFPDADTKIPARRLYDWHHVLTGSCTAGRDAFARDHGISIDADSFTVRQFVQLVSNAYGSAAIRKLAAAYGLVNNPK